MGSICITIIIGEAWSPMWLPRHPFVTGSIYITTIVGAAGSPVGLAWCPFFSSRNYWGISGYITSVPMGRWWPPRGIFIKPFLKLLIGLYAYCRSTIGRLPSVTSGWWLVLAPPFLKFLFPTRVWSHSSNSSLLRMIPGWILFGTICCLGALYLCYEVCSPRHLGWVHTLLLLLFLVLRLLVLQKPRTFTPFGSLKLIAAILLVSWVAFLAQVDSWAFA